MYFYSGGRGRSLEPENLRLPPAARVCVRVRIIKAEEQNDSRALHQPSGETRAANGCFQQTPRGPQQADSKNNERDFKNPRRI